MGPAREEPVRLRRSLGLASGSSMIVGVIVGSGIFVSPRGVLELAGSPGAALLVWALCGLLAMLGALCFAELGASVRSSGADYTYIGLAYGPLASFLYLWVTALVIIPCSNAIGALTFANYILQPVHSAEDADYQLYARSAHCAQSAAPSGANLSQPTAAQVASSSSPAALVTIWAPPEQSVRLLALALLLILTYINCTSLRASIWLQNAFTLTKVLALVLIIARGLVYLAAGASGEQASRLSVENLWAHTSGSAPELAQAFYAGFYTYAGWNALNCVTEEMRDPVRNLPRAIVLSLSSITLIYTLANLAYFAVLSRDDILGSDAIAVAFGQRALRLDPDGWLDSTLRNQLGLKLERLGLHRWLMPLLVGLSTMSGLNGGIFATSRILFAGARAGQLPSALATIHLRQATPIASLAFLLATSTFYLFTSSILGLINYMIFIEAIFAALAVSTVLVLRKRQPQLERPLRVATWVPLAYLAFSSLLIVLPMWSSPLTTLVGSLLTLAGIPVYYLTANWRPKPPGYQRAIDALNRLVQALTMSVAPELSELEADEQPEDLSAGRPNGRRVGHDRPAGPRAQK